MRKLMNLQWAWGSILLAVVLGCGNTQPAAPPMVANDKDSVIEKNLAELSPEDQKLAREQKICPVSEHPLGSMSGIYKVTYEGRTVFLCCKSCLADFEKDPKGNLAKLPPVATTTP